jgi:hypothetical protein
MLDAVKLNICIIPFVSALTEQTHKHFPLCGLYTDSVVKLPTKINELRDSCGSPLVVRILLGALPHEPTIQS